MTQAVVAGALTVAALNALAGLLGLFRWLRGDSDSRVFWVLLRVGQGSSLAFAIAVGSLAVTGHYSSDRLFYVYALVPLAVAFVAEQLRAAAAQAILDRRGLANAAAVGELREREQRRVVSEILARELAIMALSAVIVAILALRAAATAHGF
ncbi:MAG TPA: hypothetical protein VEJ23_07410 [Solirubrobacteraceae bacterium]|nr:hypothetical protein [Solirubrobacteraceae bacterium]